MIPFLDRLIHRKPVRWTPVEMKAMERAIERLKAANASRPTAAELTERIIQAKRPFPTAAEFRAHFKPPPER